MPNRTLVVVGASAGGVEALTRLAGQLPADFPATICVVQHTSHANFSYLPNILSRAGPLPATLAADGEKLRPGHIYIAAPDHHLLFSNDEIRSVRGPHENMARPSIDVLFRSAAATYTSRVIAVLLSGLLNDGTAGLWAIQRCGGITIAQDPADAAYPDMPKSAIDYGVVNYAVPLDEIAPLLDQLVRVPLADITEAPADIVMEAAISARMQSNVETEERLGTLAPISCPDCGGPLWQIEQDQVLRFRCHIGHGFTAAALLDSQASEVERALWVALRTLEERARLLQGISGGNDTNPSALRLSGQNQRLNELVQTIYTLRRLLQNQNWRALANPRDTEDPVPQA